MEVLPQAIDVNEPQVPESNCNRICEGADEIVIVSEKDCATNMYHTSNLSEAPQPRVAPGNVVGFHVAFTLVPAVFTQEVLEVSVVAAEHSLLLGWAKEILEENIPNSNRMMLAYGKWKRFISSRVLWFFDNGLHTK